MRFGILTIIAVFVLAVAFGSDPQPASAQCSGSSCAAAACAGSGCAGRYAVGCAGERRGFFVRRAPLRRIFGGRLFGRGCS